jgi:PKD repeat protein
MKNILLVIILLIPTLGFTQFTYTHTPSNNICAGTNVSFTAQNPPPNTNTLMWDFGDGSNNQTGSSVNHNFAFGGQYYVRVTAFDGQFNYIDEFGQWIDIGGAPEFYNFEYDTTCVGDDVNFWISQNGIDSLVVDFGDGNIETFDYSSAYHTYTSAGTYNVTMTVYDFCGSSTVTGTQWVGNNVPAPQAYIQVSSDTVCPGDQVSYWTNWGLDWVIDFGDGNYTTSQPYHTYNNVGVYTATATIQNGCGNTSTATQQIVVSSNGQIDPWSAQVWANNGQCPGDEIYFDAAQGFDSYHWVFENGDTASGQNVLNSFSSAGWYDYSVTFTNGCGNTYTQIDSVEVVGNNFIQNPNMDIPDSICFGEAMYFEGYADNSADVVWDFGDGEFAYLEDGSHLYNTAGNYNVSVTFSNGCGNDTTITSSVYVGNSVAPDANSTFNMAFPETACPGDEILFVSFPGGGNGTYDWDFGDGNSGLADNTINSDGTVFNYVGHQYNIPGNYTATITYTNTCGASIIQSVDVQIIPGSQPEAGLIFENEYDFYCVNTPVTFFGAGGIEYKWNFGDGTGLQTGPETLEPFEHTYENPGTYEVMLIVKNSCGMTDTTTEQITISNTFVNINTTSVDANCGQANGTAVAAITGGNQPYEIEWSSGHSGIIADSLTSGLYYISVSDSKGCFGEAVVAVSDEEAPTILIDNILDVSCAGGDDGAIDIELIGSTGPYNYTWSNGKATQDINNLDPGPYELIVTDANGCIATESMEVEEPNNVNISFTKIRPSCGNSNGVIEAQAAGGTGPYSYVWDHGGTSAIINGVPAGVYGLNVIDANGCLFQKTVTLSEQGSPFLVTDSISSLACGGQASIYVHAIGGQSPYSYTWSNGSTNQNLINVSSGEYWVEVTGNSGCTLFESFEIEQTQPNGLPICMVDVNPGTAHNMIIWEKAGITDIEWINIYKESSASGVYQLIGTQHFDSLSTFVDNGSNAEVQSYRYKLSGVDFCGTESSLSQAHKTIHLTSNIGVSNEINLIWENYTGFSYSTYNIWRYSSDGVTDTLENIASVPNNISSYSDINPPTGVISLHYYLEAVPDFPCVSSRANNHNTSRSNKTSPVAGPFDSIEELNRPEIALYPNPATSGFYLDLLGANPQNARYELYSLEGKLIRTGKLSVDKEFIPTDGIQLGLYFVNVYIDKQMISKKILIEK